MADYEGTGTLLPPDERDKLTARLQHAVNAFVDSPRGAVEEADEVLHEAVNRVTKTLAHRRRTIRTAWQSMGEGEERTADTEQLRLALRDYRETAERLLSL
ncbi:hypothetical protein [Streptomyces himalayensis]|uniref:Uncharacterized protein n=2 Tax=Streptomyces himalayensis TaxID=2820085 RepID=A0A7W2HI97_9ACTN|nr:hypothetical protein [Streptomyces himalayensis]MBA2948784.1 hypothetical protein [Streptomyces himalayensis subsp. himalayensis]MBA4864842.1 hypothetical protein [Streptomyces himalayensis subsp. aureolus]